MRSRILCAAALLVCSCSEKSSKPATTAPAGDAVAMAGDSTLLQADLDHALRESGNLPPAAVLQRLAEEESLAAMARAEGIDQDPSVRAAVRRILAARLSEKHLTVPQVTDAEVQAALASEAPAAEKPRLRLAFLRQRSDTAGSMEAAAAQLEEARKAWQALPEEERARGFDSIAAQFSDDTDTRYQGGDAGWIAAGDRHLLLPAEATTTAAELGKPGLIPDVIRTADAAWLVLVTETGKSRPAGPAPEAVRSRLTAEREAAARKSLTERAAAVAPIRILKELPGTSPAPPPAAPPSGP